eukprot:gene2417-biopygen1303
MIGIKYLRYHPKLIYQLPSGLAIYQSVFRNSDGGSGVIGGPHPIFTTNQSNFFNDPEMLSGFFSNQHQLYKMEVQVNPDVKHLTLSFPSSSIKRFEDTEATGSLITYRCVNCRHCKECKNSTHQREVSIKEGVEQSIIDSSIYINLEIQTIIAKLPFIDQPTKLSPNKDIALKVYYQQLKKLSRPENQQDKADIIASEAKLQKLGFVDFVDNLSPEQPTTLKNSAIQNYIPWRAVWKTSSISTPCRIVYDASHPTSSGHSLNDLLAKGQNKLNKLQEILIRWSAHRIGIHTDVRKMYNTIRLDEQYWHFQRYIWQNDLDPAKIPKEKVIKTLIYGIHSSGNQAECGLRSVAQLCREDYPEVSQIIQNDVYVDDCITGESSTKEAFKRADELETVTSRGSFILKGFTFSRIKPSEDLSDYGASIAVGGMKWFPETDELTLNISDLNFSKKRRGKKSAKATNIIPQKLTCRDCASKVAEIFNITRKMAPIVPSMKLDLNELSLRQLEWDDLIPEELRPNWLNNFQMMKELGKVRFNRAIIPEDAVSTDTQALDFGNASKSLLWVRNRVMEINRFKTKESWFYIQTNNMIADLGTRRGATIADVDKESQWIYGMDWMKLPESEFPMKSSEDLKVSESDIKEIDKE